MAETPATDIVNLRVLQRHNPNVTNIVSIAPFTVIYTFSAESQTWEKSGVEGSLFVCALRPLHEGAPERFSVMLLNRRSLENFEVELLHESDVEVADEFIILQSNNAIYGLWVFEEKPPSSTANMRETQARVIRECASRAEQSNIAEQQRQAPLQVTQQSSAPSDQIHSRAPANAPNGNDIDQHRANLLAQFQQPSNAPVQHATRNDMQPQQDILTDLFSRARGNYEASRM